MYYAIARRLEQRFPETVEHVKKLFVEDYRRNGIDVTMKAVNGVALFAFAMIVMPSSYLIHSLVGRACLCLGTGAFAWGATRYAKACLEGL